MDNETIWAIWYGVGYVICWIIFMGFFLWADEDYYPGQLGAAGFLSLFWPIVLVCVFIRIAAWTFKWTILAIKKQTKTINIKL
jgi:hypothetical protein